MRIEDLDRVRPGAAEQQLADLKSLGLDWDATPGEDPQRHDHVLRQSTRLAAYDAAVQKLQGCRAALTNAIARAVRF